ncbi:MarR family transcriptional regulator [Catenibacterium sp. AM22-15]|uniref:MarR family winged helix-turn-helix transcriptional regulator n=1 Tax=unclassified Catenibacterium TaxID=2643636 RepID=UPI000E3F3B0D|nr:MULTISPECIES: MarR family transcriptional regulator [unclassified Catenibacterium]RGF00320.1 MarR family transcriptional regulator [Catenibacterium sp. AM22-6LB]RGF09377.1 MarR family transcriptional regulator [Catenibacterium sp. AM22-15]
MNSQKTKEMLDSCYIAKRILDLLPELPESVLPSYIRYLETIIDLKERNGRVKVSEISEALNLPRPGVTRTVRSMVEKGYLIKRSSKEDGRVTYIEVSEKGQALFEKFNKEYFEDLSQNLSHISIEEADCMIETIEKFYQVMCERRKS